MVSMTKLVAFFTVFGMFADARMSKQLSEIRADAQLDRIELKEFVFKSAGHASDDLKILRQPAGSVTEASYQNWFSRMGDAFTSVLIGILLILTSIPCMWVNERRAARFESLIAVGQGECKTVAYSKAQEDNHGTLVHVSGANAEGKKPLQDDRFADFKFSSKCLRIRSSVEAYQWVEHEKTEKRKDRVGGGETTIKTYTYTKQWTGSSVDSSCFKQGDHENHLAKPSLALGTNTKTCTTVYYGEAFQLPEEMVEQLSNFEDASAVLGSSAGGFTKSDNFYYYPAKKAGEPNIGDMRATFKYIPDSPVTAMGLQTDEGEPNIDDMRATFKYIPDSPVTAMGLQTDEANLTRASFMPYRLVSRGCCCCAVSDEKLKTLQIKEGQKTAGDLYNDDKVFHLFPGDLNQSACWKKIKFETGMQKWILRLLAWLLMLVGLNMCFEPLFTEIDIIPFLGPFLSKFISWVVFACAFIVTVTISTLVISIAYLFYHPLVGMFYLVIAAACVSVPIAIIQLTKS